MTSQTPLVYSSRFASWMPSAVPSVLWEVILSRCYEIRLKSSTVRGTAHSLGVGERHRIELHSTTEL